MLDTQIISAARFRILAVGSPIGEIGFSDLGGITSKVGPADYVYNNKKGETVISKQIGKTDPPTITLKRGLDKVGNGKLMAWHALARMGKLKEAKTDLVLSMLDASGRPQIEYKVEGAWCTDLTISAAKANDSSVVTIEVKISCDNILAK